MSKEPTRHEDLITLQQALENKLGWGPAKEWHNTMFDELSEKIFDNCRVMLSSVTLKRFWGILTYSGYPSISTLDTLSQFIGFKNWRDYKMNGNLIKAKKPSSSVSRKSLYVSAGFVTALFVIALVGSQLSNKTIEIPETVTFSSRPLVRTYPNSVVFDFNLDHVQSDSIHIQQYWDVTKTILVNSDQNQATGIYYFPGYFRAQLMVDGQSVKEHDLFLKSHGWIGTVDYKPVPKYFTPTPLFENGLSYPTSLNKEIEQLADPIFSVYHYINDLGSVSGDNFTLQSSIRTTFNDKWAVCQAAQIYIIGTDGAMILPFSDMGCSSDNILMLNDVYLDGKKSDLSGFATDLSNFTDIELQVKDKELTVLINGEKSYHGQYSQTMGKLVGMRYKFLGLGEVQSIEVKDQNGTVVPLK